MLTSYHENLLYQLTGQRVRKRRRGKFTQEELADMIDVSRTSVTNLELGRQRVPLHQLLRIADALRCELRDLVPLRAQVGLGKDTSDEISELPVVGPVTPAVRDVINRFTAGGEGNES